MILLDELGITGPGSDALGVRPGTMPLAVGKNVTVSLLSAAVPTVVP